MADQQCNKNPGCACTNCTCDPCTCGQQQKQNIQSSHHHHAPMYSQVLPGQSYYAPPNMSTSIKGQSRVEYFPIERRTIEYEQVEKTVTEQVPRQVIQYDTVERKIYEQVPREKIWTDYQAVEYQKEYVPRVCYDTVQEQVPVRKVDYVPVTRVEYVPQERTDYVTQSRQVERVEYDEIEYQVQRPQVQYSQGVQHLGHSQGVQHLGHSHVVQAPVYSSQYIQQPLYSSQARVLGQNVSIPEQYRSGVQQQ